MNINERAAQAWAVLAWAARHRQTITYQQLSQVTGMHTAGVGRTLDPIQAYCVARRLPPMTSIVVQRDTGLPGVGYTAAQAVQVASDQAKVFDFDWLKHGNPQDIGLDQNAAPVIGQDQATGSKAVKTAWEHIVKAASNLHAQGHATLTHQQLHDEALRLGWSGASSTISTHITAHMRDDVDGAHRPYLERVSDNTYRLNAAGRRAAEGL